MKDKAAADRALEISRAQITRREGLTLSAATIMASLLPVSALAAMRTASTREENTMAPANATQKISTPRTRMQFVRFV